MTINEAKRDLREAKQRKQEVLKEQARIVREAHAKFNKEIAEAREHCRLSREELLRAKQDKIAAKKAAQTAIVTARRNLVDAIIQSNEVCGYRSPKLTGPKQETTRERLVREEAERYMKERGLEW